MTRNWLDWNPLAVPSSGRNDGELLGRHRLEHVELSDDGLEDLRDPPRGVQGAGAVAVLEAALQQIRLVQDLLEPQLVDLMDDHEQHLVVFIGSRTLAAEQLIEAEIAAVGGAHGTIILDD